MEVEENEYIDGDELEGEQSTVDVIGDNIWLQRLVTSTTSATGILICPIHSQGAQLSLGIVVRMSQLGFHTRTQHTHQRQVTLRFPPHLAVTYSIDGGYSLRDPASSRTV